MDPFLYEICRRMIEKENDCHHYDEDDFDDDNDYDQIDSYEDTIDEETFLHALMGNNNDDDNDDRPNSYFNRTLPTYSLSELSILSNAIGLFTTSSPRRRHHHQRQQQHLSTLVIDQIVDGIDWYTILVGKEYRPLTTTTTTTPIRGDINNGGNSPPLLMPSSSSSCTLLRLSVGLCQRRRIRRRNYVPADDDGDEVTAVVYDDDYEYIGLRELAGALYWNTSLKEIEITNIGRLDDDEIDEQDDAFHHYQEYPSDEERTEEDDYKVLPSPLQLLFEGILSIEKVILRGIIPDASISTSQAYWRHLTMEACDLSQPSSVRWGTPYLSTMMSSCISTLEEFCITDCDLSAWTIQTLIDVYEAYSVQPRNSSRRRTKKRSIQKNPLTVLNLSCNTWIAPLPEVENDNDDRVASPLPDASSPSCMILLSGLLDTLSNLVELNLSYNSSLFESSSSDGIEDLCGTVNSSIRRLCLRQCHLTPSHLYLIVQTFCFLEVLDVSENPHLLIDNNINENNHNYDYKNNSVTVSARSGWALLQLENLTELILQNMGLGEEDLDDLFAAFIMALIPNHYYEYNHASVGGQYGDNVYNRNTTLRMLDLSGNVLGQKTMRVLGTIRSLSHLSLAGCQIQNEGLVDLLGMSSPVGGNHTAESTIIGTTHRPCAWQEVDLSSNNIGDVGILALTQSLKEKQFPHLQVLHMTSNVISVHAFKTLVEHGLAYHCPRLRTLSLFGDGAVTDHQKDMWDRIEATMNHYLLLNRAGRVLLYDDNDDDSGCSNSPKRKIQSSVWPYLLEGADTVYGVNALYYFLRHRPDIIQSTSSKKKKQEEQQSSICVVTTTTPKTAISKPFSPKCVMDGTSLF